MSLLWCLWLVEEGKEKTVALHTFETSQETTQFPICRAALINIEDLPIKLKFGNVPGCFQGIWGKMFLFLDNQNYHISWVQQGSLNWKMCKCVLPGMGTSQTKVIRETLFSTVLFTCVTDWRGESFPQLPWCITVNALGKSPSSFGKWNQSTYWHLLALLTLWTRQVCWSSNMGQFGLRWTFFRYKKTSYLPPLLLRWQ